MINKKREPKQKLAWPRKISSALDVIPLSTERHASSWTRLAAQAGIASKTRFYIRQIRKISRATS